MNKVQITNILCCLTLLFVITGTASSQTPEELLNKAYKEKSKDLLDSFFVQWQSKSEPLNTEEFGTLNDTAKIIYTVYKQFMDSVNYLIPASVKIVCKHLIIQNKIKYQIVEDDNFDSLYIPADFLKKQYRHIIVKKDSIERFRPKILNTEINVLYLSDIYEKILFNYLYDTNKLEYKRKLRFLNRQVEIWSLHGFLEENWHLETMPLMTQIELSNDLSKIKFSFSIGKVLDNNRKSFLDFRLLYKKENGSWTKKNFSSMIFHPVTDFSEDDF